MEKPGKKLKKFLLITGTAGAVYAGFKYLLPLAAPFFAGYVFALLLRPSARFFAYRLRVTVGGRTFRAPIGLIGGAEFLLLLTALGTAAYWGLTRLWKQASLLAARLPGILASLKEELGGYLTRLEAVLQLPDGALSQLAGEALADLAGRGREAVMPLLMVNSVAVLALLARWAVVALVAFLAAVLSLQEMEDLRERRDQSLFRREFNLIGRRLVQTGKAWFKSQGVTLFAVTAFCTVGLFLMKNPYYMMLGAALGLLDALPILGAGTALLPWALWQLAAGRLREALALAVLYLVCYSARQLLETRLMGGQVGLTPLETLAAVYAGLELFGFAGFILGPLGLLLIEDLTAAWDTEPLARSPERKKGLA